MNDKLLIADLFCGAGGSSTGAERAVRELHQKMVLVCVNHWPIAIETHKKNHPSARHYVEDVTVANPEKIVTEGYLDLLMASPECTHFSRARGGKPMHDQSRMNPWAIHRWLTTLDVRCVLVENVPEFVDWGPLNGGNRPDPDKKGLYFEAWVRSLWDLGYTVDWKYLNAADYGDATTRTRFFLIARKDGVPISWPEPSHAADGAGDMFDRLPRWRAAKEIIDWDNTGRSLFDDPKYKKRPLSVNTRRRIAGGLKKYGGIFAPLYISLLGVDADLDDGGSAVPESFTIQNRKNGRARSMEEPVYTITASNGGGGLMKVDPILEPFVLGQQSCSVARDTRKPIMTISTSGAISLIEPQLVIFHGASETQVIDKPLQSILTQNHIGLVEPQIVKYYGTEDGTESIDDPLSTVTTKSRFGLVEPGVHPFIVQNRLYGDRKDYSRAPHDVGDPLPAITGHGAGALVNPIVIQTDQSGRAGTIRSVDKPVHTIVTKNNTGVAVPVLQELEDQDVDPRRIIYIDDKPYLLDIRFRMLSNRELARAMGFDDKETEYEFVGNQADVTRQIGNAVPVNLAAALVKEILR